MTKARTMPLEVQLKESDYKTSLQCPYKDQIISPLDLFQYDMGNFKNIRFFFASDKCVEEARALLPERVASAERIGGTGDYHNFIPISNFLTIYLSVSTVYTSISNQIKVSAVGKQPAENLDPNNISIGFCVTCMYDKK